MEKKEYPWLTTLLSYFKTIKEYDTKIESLRSSLCSNQNFSSLSLFSYLDKDLKSFLTLNDFKSFLNSQNISYDENKLRKLIHNFDKDNDFCLNLQEFSSLIKSKRINQKNEFLSNYKKEINEEIISDLKNILEKEMELITELNEIAKEIKNSEIFSTYEAFTVIVGKDKYITKKNFGKFLNDNFMEVNEEDANNIMFRIDADNDDKISYEEFKEIFYPIKEDYSINNNNKYENNNYNNIDIANKYLNLENEKESNNFENMQEQNNENSEDIKNEDKKEEEEEKDDNIIDEDNNINQNNKKKKTTKKIILKPKLQSNINSDSETYLLHSPYTGNINENNNTYKNKCTSCGVQKKDNNINKNLVNKYNIKPENENDLNIYQEENNINTNILREKNNINNIPNNEYNPEYKSGKCKACQYTAKNIYTDLRTKNNNNIPIKSSDKFENENENILQENNYNNFNENKNDKNEENEYDINDIYKNKDELLKKYGINNNITNLNDQNEIDFTGFNFSTQKKFKPIKEVNDNLDNINISPIQRLENDKTIFKSKKIISSNNNNYYQENASSNFISSDLRTNIIPKNDINEKKQFLFKLFVDFIEKETELEKIKQSLLSCQDATPQNIFELFNKNNSNKISSSDILETLNSLSSKKSFESDDIKYIFKKYNKTISNGFTLEDLSNMFFSNKNSFNNEEAKLEENTKNIIFELFKEIIEGEKAIENSRNLLEKASDNIFYDLFESIKKENMSGIEKDDIDKFLKENEYDVKDNDIDIIMEKMDKNRDNLIDYGEFIDEIKPMNFC